MYDLKPPLRVLNSSVGASTCMGKQEDAQMNNEVKLSKDEMAHCCRASRGPPELQRRQAESRATDREQMVFVMTSGRGDMERRWHAARVATDIVTMERALEVGEFVLAGVPHDSGASAQHQGHAHHATNCTRMEAPITFSNDTVSGSQLTILLIYIAVQCRTR